MSVFLHEVKTPFSKYLLNKAIEIQPKEWNAWVMKGIVFKNREDYKSAKICFETALIFDKKKVISGEIYYSGIIKNININNKYLNNLKIYSKIINFEGSILLNKKLLMIELKSIELVQLLLG